MPDDKPASTGRNPDGTFAPGNSINPRGRPRGSRNKLGEAFFNDLYAEWQAHGPEVITKVREERPEVFLKVVASTLPKDLNITNENVFDDYSTEELDRAIRALLNEIAEQEAAAEDDEAKPADGLHQVEGRYEATLADLALAKVTGIGSSTRIERVEPERSIEEIDARIRQLLAGHATERDKTSKETAH